MNSTSRYFESFTPDSPQVLAKDGKSITAKITDNMFASSKDHQLSTLDEDLNQAMEIQQAIQSTHREETNPNELFPPQISLDDNNYEDIIFIMNSKEINHHIWGIEEAIEFLQQPSQHLSSIMDYEEQHQFTTEQNINQNVDDTAVIQVSMDATTAAAPMETQSTKKSCTKQPKITTGKKKKPTATKKPKMSVLFQTVTPVMKKALNIQHEEVLKLCDKTQIHKLYCLMEEKLQLDLKYNLIADAQAKEAIQKDIRIVTFCIEGRLDVIRLYLISTLKERLLNKKPKLGKLLAKYCQTLEVLKQHTTVTYSPKGPDVNEQPIYISTPKSTLDTTVNKKRLHPEEKTETAIVVKRPKIKNYTPTPFQEINMNTSTPLIEKSKKTEENSPSPPPQLTVVSKDSTVADEDANNNTEPVNIDQNIESRDNSRSRSRSCSSNSSSSSSSSSNSSSSSGSSSSDSESKAKQTKSQSNTKSKKKATTNAKPSPAIRPIPDSSSDEGVDDPTPAPKKIRRRKTKSTPQKSTDTTTPPPQESAATIGTPETSKKLTPVYSTTPRFIPAPRKDIKNMMSIQYTDSEDEDEIDEEEEQSTATDVVSAPTFRPDIIFSNVSKDVQLRRSVRQYTREVNTEYVIDLARHFSMPGSKPSKTIIDKYEKKIMKIVKNVTDKLNTKRGIIIAEHGLTDYPEVSVTSEASQTEVSVNNTLLYPKTMNLVSIKSIAKLLSKIQLQLKEFPKLAVDEISYVLKWLSTTNSNSSSVSLKHNITNCNLDMLEYPLVYGAVPHKYDQVTYSLLVNILNYLKKDPMMENRPKSKNGKQSSTVEKAKALISDGELELLTYCYWKLDTQDLVMFREENRRNRKTRHQTAKLLLMFIWHKMDKLVKKWEAKEDQPSYPESMDIFKKVLSNLLTYGNFTNTYSLDYGAILALKLNMSAIYMECKVQDRHVIIWDLIQTLFIKVKAHFYMMPHTIMELHAMKDHLHMKLLNEYKIALNNQNLSLAYTLTQKKILPSQINEAAANKTIFSKHLMTEIFQAWITHGSGRGTKNAAGKELNKLCIRMDNMFLSFAQKLASDLVRWNYIDNAYIHRTIMEGHIKAMQERIPYAQPLSQCFPLLRSNPLRQAFKGLVGQLVGQLQFHQGTASPKTINISDEAMDMWLDYMMSIVSHATGGIALHIGTKVKESDLYWTQSFVEAIDSFMNRYMCDIKQPDMWVMNDVETDDSDYEGDNTSYEYSTEESSDDDYDSSEEESDNCYNTEEEYENECNKSKKEAELTNLMCDVGQPPVSQVPVIGRKQTTPKSSQIADKESSKYESSGNSEALKSARKRKTANEKLISVNKYFLYLERESKISRAQCILCFSSTSRELLSLSENCAIVCCKQCICALNILTEEEAEERRAEIIRRVDNRYKVPLGFKVEKSNIGNIAARVWIEKMDDIVSAKDMTPSTYNRLSVNFKKRMVTGLAKTHKKMRKSK